MDKKSNKQPTSLFSNIFGSSFRRLKIYYLNNTKTSKCIILLIIILFAYLYYGTNLIRGKSLGYVGYKYDQEDEYWMSDDEVQEYLNQLEDTRPSQCLDQAFDFNNMFDFRDTVSIVMHFHGKTDSGHFKLTISAIIDHTPFDLYLEIIVIDDGTKDTEYKQKVTRFLATPRFNKVKVYRSEKHEGTSATRLKASLIAKGTILVFVSSDVIVNEGWIQPLIAKVCHAPVSCMWKSEPGPACACRYCLQVLEGLWSCFVMTGPVPLNNNNNNIASEEATIAVPHYDNMLTGHRFFKTDDSLSNTFSWSLYTIAFENPHEDKEEFIRTSVFRGEVLAVKKSFLTRIGGYDDHFEVDGGGESLELSFRTWLCGGSVKVAKCSRVAVHSSLRPLSINSASNYRYITELWFSDEYKDIAYRQGNISSVLSSEERLALQTRRDYFRSNNIQCRDFNWYLTYVAKEVITPSENMIKFGKLKTKAAFCIRAISEVDVEMVLCRHHIYDREMMFEMDRNGAIFKGDSCLSIDTAGRETGVTNKLILATCEDGSQKQVWQFFGTTLTLTSRPEQCLTQVSERDRVSNELKHYAKLKDCSTAEVRLQTWEFISY